MLREAVDFILTQQRKDGSFGFYRDEIELIRKSEQGFDPLDKIILPITVSAMWTLAEATRDGFSLFNSVRTHSREVTQILGRSSPVGRSLAPRRPRVGHIDPPGSIRASPLNAWSDAPVNLRFSVSVP